MNNKQFQLSALQTNQKSDNQYIEKQEQQNNGKLNAFREAINFRSFAWRIVRFIILAYYLVDAILLLSFPSFYKFSYEDLLPLNILFFILLIWDLFIKIQNVDKLQLKKHISAFKKFLRIIWHYLYVNFLILDLIVIIIFFAMFMVDQPIGQYLRFFIFLRIGDLIQFNNEIYFIIYNRRIWLKIYTLVKLAFVFYLFSHYFGCIFFLIDQNAIDQQWYGPISENPLLYYQGNLLCWSPIQALDDAGRYLYGLYFLVSLISTIAYGDIVGKNPPQQVLVTFLMVVSTVAIAIILEQLMEVLVQSFNFYEFIKKYNSLKSYMDSRDVGLDLQNRVRSYLVYIQYQKKFREQEPIIDKISLKLKKQIFYSGYKKRIGVLFDPIINKESDIFQLCNLIQEVTFYEEAQLFQPRVSLEQNYLYEHLGYLSHIDGQTLIYVQYDQSSLPIVLGQRKQYNFYELLTGTSTRYGVVAKSLSHFAKISTSAFLSFLQATDTEMIAKWYAQKMICGQIAETMIQEYCLVCKFDGHKNETCPKMHLVHRNKDTLYFDKNEPEANNIIDIHDSFSKKSRMHRRNKAERNNSKCKKTWPRKVAPQTEKNIFSLLMEGVVQHNQQNQHKLSIISDLGRNKAKQETQNLDENALNMRYLMNSDFLAQSFISVGGNLVSNLFQTIKIDSLYDPKGIQEKFKVYSVKEDQRE